MNFQELAQKIRRIDEGAVVECGDMMAGHMPMQQPMPQQDTVSMNVSMNATGKGGIRDLMQVLQNIEDGVTHGSAPSIVDITPSDMHIDSEPDMDASMMGGEVEVEPEFDADDGEEEIVFGGEEEPEISFDKPDAEMDAQAQDGKGIDPKIKHAIAPVVQAVGLAHALGKDPTQVFKGDKVTDEEDMPMDYSDAGEEQLASEEFANRPNAKYQSQNYMTKTLAGGADEPQRMHKHSYRSGDNPMSMKEGLQGRLANLYQEVKLRESKADKFDPLKHVKNPTKGEKTAAKDVKRGSYADRAAMLKSAETDGRLKD
jgi:hypothetical protein